MAKWISGNFGNGTVASGVTVFAALDGGSTGLTESNAQIRVRGSYTMSNLRVNVTAITGTLTVTSRKNGAAGAQTISVTTTGQKEDVTHTDSLVSGDLVDISLAMSGAHPDNSIVQTAGMLLDDAGGNIPISACTGSTSFTTAATFSAIFGNAGISTTETNCQYRFRVAATLSNFMVFLSANSFTGTTTWRTRTNAANGGQSVSYAAAITGGKEDTTGTDTVAAGDKVNFAKDAGGTANTATLARMQVKSAAAAKPLLAASGAGVSIGVASTSDFFSLCSNLVAAGSEANSQIKAAVADTFLNMQINVTANTRSDATVADLRAGSASPGGGPSISVPAATTGILEDLTGSYSSAVADLLNYRVVTGTGTGSITFTTVGCQQGKEAAAPVLEPWWQLAQQGAILAQ